MYIFLHIRIYTYIYIYIYIYINFPVGVRHAINKINLYKTYTKETYNIHIRKTYSVSRLICRRFCCCLAHDQFDQFRLFRAAKYSFLETRPSPSRSIVAKRCCTCFSVTFVSARCM